MTNKDCPCMECVRREIGCHGRCQAYMDWKKKKDKAKSIVVAEKNAEREYLSFNEERKKRVRKRMGK